MFNVMPSWMISFLGHVGLIVLLAFLVMPQEKKVDTSIIASASPSESVETIELDMAEFDDEIMEDLSESDFELGSELEVDSLVELDVTEPLESAEFLEAEAMLFEEGDFGQTVESSGSGDEIGSRSGDRKKAALQKFGGSAASEEAVQLALKWIVKHQLPDGGWNLNHQLGPGDFRNSPNPGMLVEARNAATALALLPLLGSGNTHRSGDYKSSVNAGLKFLMGRAEQKGRGISYVEPGGSTYSHGLCSIVFCEAFAMTRDPALAPYAQGTIWFSEDFQDPVGGGWKYVRPPTLSVASWQVMAMKSAKMSGLDINPATWRLVDRYLNSVSNTDGSRYGYNKPPGRRKRASLTAIGLLCRMYMGWTRDNPGIKSGIELLARQGPDLAEGTAKPVDMYYNYYATQVIKQYGGNEWQEWNDRLRDNLIESQHKEGNRAGSWYFNTPSPYQSTGKKAGRLYTTALACMTLEVYYRFLPIYSEASTSEEFRFE